MTDAGNKRFESPQHRLRVVGVVAALALLVGVGGAASALAGSQAIEDRNIVAIAGIAAALFAFALGAWALPFAHWLLGDVGRQRLVAAASPVHPLLKRLMSEAPGTYAHSIAAAGLSEAAAEAIGADALLSRVAAYYHDVGKLARPCYFFENSEGANPHDDATPTTSASIITSHVTDGLALAERYRLPSSVFDIINEHHGTSLVRYFYHKAAAADAAVFEADFRYRGERPRSKEAAIVMLADASEAAVRAMSDPDGARIESSVRAVVAERRADGQLEHAGLADAELETIIDTFVRNLVSLKHVRCPYPAQELGECEHADQCAKPSGA